MKQFKGVPGPWVFDDLSMKIKGTGDIEGMTVMQMLVLRWIIQEE